MENTACRCGSMVQWKAAARRRCYCYLGCLHSRTPDYGVGASEVLLASAHPFPLIHVEGEVHMLPSCYGEASWSTVSGDEERHCGEGRCTMDARPPRVLCSLLAGEDGVELLGLLRSRIPRYGWWTPTAGGGDVEHLRLLGPSVYRSAAAVGTPQGSPW